MSDALTTLAATEAAGACNPAEPGDTADSTPPAAPTVVLLGCPNHRASELKPCLPWTFAPGAIPETATRDKAAWTKWCSEPTTQHLFYTGCEGENVGIRISKANPLRRMHALVADYDTTIDAAMLTDLLSRCNQPPNWLSHTFSGGVRLVWLFDAPLAMDNAKLADKFLRHAMVELRLKKLLPGLDENAWLAPSKTYEVGRGWQQLSTDVLSANVLNFWLFEAAAKVDWGRMGTVNVPIADVAEQVERQFPGRWQGEFVLGARGCVFFEPGFVNHTTSIVSDGGLITFSMPKVFYSWDEIFGKAWADKYQADKIGQAVKGVWFSGKGYYMKTSWGTWEPSTKEDFSMWLKVKHGMDAGRDRGEAASEVERTLVYVQEHRRVSGVVPKVYDPEELLVFNGRRFLNCAAVRCLQPAVGVQTWGQDFPWLAQFFDTCWDATPVVCPTGGVPDADPKDVFLAWLQRFYATALQGDMLKGQALFIAGGVGRGKTLLSSTIIGKMMGGAADASDFLSSDTSFNKELLEVALWNVDDGTAAQDPKAHQKFTEMVKRSVANPFFNYHPKFCDPQRVWWAGRMIVTFNDDASSIRILPNLDASIDDKVIILKFSDAARTFPGWGEMNDTVERELPFFLRWLLDWAPPAAILGETRYGVRSFVHEELRVQSLHSGGVGDLLELVELWVKRCAPQATFGPVWEGSASEWMAEVMGDDTLRPLVQKFTPRALGRKFVDASRIRDTCIEVAPTKHKGNGNYYRISFDPAAGDGKSPPPQGGGTVTVNCLADLAAVGAAA